MLWEVVANSVDENLAGYASRVRVSVEDDLVEVEDDGRGLPTEMHRDGRSTVLERVLTVLHARATYDGHLPHVHLASSGMGIGLAAVNALTRELFVQSRNRGYVWRQRYACGKAVTALERGERTDRTGTLLRFRPDPTIFTSIRFDRAAIRERLHELAFFNPGATFELMAETIREPKGIAGWVERATVENGTTEASEVFATRAIRDDVFVEAAFAWSKGRGVELRSFVGQRETCDGGAHERGFWEGIVRAVGRYSQRLRPARIRARLEQGLVAIVHVDLRDVRFGGPTRNRLESPEARDATAAQIAEAFDAHLAQRPALVRALVAKLES
jgi:DNA gyrase/topoisomerase IV subunit B